MKPFRTLHPAWKFLHDHRLFRDKHGNTHFHDALRVEVVKTNPKTGLIDKNPALNTATRVWIELGPLMRHLDMPRRKRPNYPTCKEPQISTQMNIDIDAKSLTQGIIELANIVRKYWGA